MHRSHVSTARDCQIKPSLALTTGVPPPLHHRCKFGAQCKKPTDLWVSETLPRTIEFLGTEDDPKWFCTPDSPCWMGGDSHHMLVRGNAKKFTPYHEGFVRSVLQVIDQDLAHLRKTQAPS